jgi:integrase
MTDLQPTDPSPETPAELPEGITLEDAERITQLAEEDRRPSTRRVYRSKWSLFASWCSDRGADPLPASEELLSAYLAERAETVSLSTIRQDVAAVKWMHERRGLESPTEGAGIGRVLDGIAQTSDPSGGRGKKQAALTEHIRKMVEALPLEAPAPDEGVAAEARHLRALRDRAILLVGYAGAFRRSELATIRSEDVSRGAKGMEIHVPETKTDPRTVGITYAEDASLCPVRALGEWTGAAGIEEGPIFRAVPRSAKIATGEEAEPITGKTVRNVIGDAAEDAGLDPERMAGHSLRRGHITQGALHGAGLDRLMKQAGHADPRTTAEYVEDARRMETTTAQDLGL